ncbi:hypothetical protein PG996_006676 [Apiospora saccharicola]|uniref:Uncharacterized protein n=1 Tax=Apiospora saccharicola TaxID=335842 RepID=A0ABR1VC07_9PEZI
MEPPHPRKSPFLQACSVLPSSTLHPRALTFIPATHTFHVRVTDVARGTIRPPVPFQPGWLVPHAGGDGLVVALALGGALLIHTVPRRLHLGAATGVPEPPVADGDAHVAVVDEVGIKGPGLAVVAVAPLLEEGEGLVEHLLVDPGPAACGFGLGAGVDGLGLVLVSGQ